MAEPLATRSAALALAAERTLMRQGHQFLDEKRMLLAAALLRALAEHAEIESALHEAAAAAGAAWGRALQRHGLAGLQAYPGAPPSRPPRTRRASLLGVAQIAVDEPPRAGRGPDEALDASPEAAACSAAFGALLAPLAALAACRGNLERLAAELRRTQRRARALENVLLPEVEGRLAAVEGRLELADQEEAVRTRLAARRTPR